MYEDVCLSCIAIDICCADNKYAEEKGLLPQAAGLGSSLTTTPLLVNHPASSCHQGRLSSDNSFLGTLSLGRSETLEFATRL